MPIYDYSANAGNYFEKKNSENKKNSERSSAECPECHKEANSN